MSITLTPQDGYTLPDSVTVTMNGATLTDGYTYENGVLTIDEVYGNTVITAKAVLVENPHIRFRMTFMVLRRARVKAM